MPKKMILITNLDVWLLSSKVKKPGAGNQSLYNTLLGYAHAAWEVHMLTSRMVLADMPPVHDNVIIHREPIFRSKAFSLLKPLVKRLLGVPKSGIHSREITTSMSPPSKIDWLYTKLFCQIMASRAVKLARELGGVAFIYGHEIHGALAGRDAAKRLKVPLVNRFQGTELGQLLDQPEKLLSYKTWVEATKIDADLIIMANDGTRGDQVLDFLGVPKWKYRFYMNGVVKEDVYRPDVDKAKVRRELGIADNEVFILYTGRMFYWKRIDRHIEVIKRVSNACPDFKAVFIGDGPEMYAVKRLSSRLELDDRVIFLGAMAHSQVMDYLNACDVYISFHDLSNLSNPVIEACVCGKCIVTTDVGGTTDLLTDGVNAVVVPNRDSVEAITRALIKVLRNSNERVRLAEGARQRGRQLKSWQERMFIETDEVAKMLARKTSV
jgi:glycosyltransferase involved in cell wall biosynthesis